MKHFLSRRPQRSDPHLTPEIREELERLGEATVRYRVNDSAFTESMESDALYWLGLQDQQRAKEVRHTRRIAWAAVGISALSLLVSFWK